MQLSLTGTEAMTETRTTKATTEARTTTPTLHSTSPRWSQLFFNSWRRMDFVNLMFFGIRELIRGSRLVKLDRVFSSDFQIEMNRLLDRFLFQCLNSWFVNHLQNQIHSELVKGTKIQPIAPSSVSWSGVAYSTMYFASRLQVHVVRDFWCTMYLWLFSPWAISCLFWDCPQCSL